MVKKKKPNFIRIIYSIMAVSVVGIGAVFFMINRNSDKQEIAPDKLLTESLCIERYLSTDEVSNRIINQDPTLKLIDVRNVESFNNYALPNSVNIPLSEMCKEENEEHINQDQYDVVFYSNDHFQADQAWILCSRLGFKNLYVLKGGINAWYETIINPMKPNENMPEKDFIAYSTRKAASMHYGVAYPDLEKFVKPKVVTKPPKKVVTVKKKKKKKPEGGC